MKRIMKKIVEEQTKLLKQQILRVRGAKVTIDDFPNDDALFAYLLEKYPKSVMRFKILYKRFKLLNRLQKAKKHITEKQIVKQNRIFERFYKRAKKGKKQFTIQLPPLGKGLCLGATLDVAAKRAQGDDPDAAIYPTARARYLQEEYIVEMLIVLERLKTLYRDLDQAKFALQDAPSYFALYEKACERWAQFFLEIGGDKLQNQFLQKKRQFEKRVHKNNLNDPAIYKEFFEEVNELAICKVGEVPKSLLQEVGIEILPLFKRTEIPVEKFINSLDLYVKRFSRKKGAHVMLEFHSEIEKSNHVIYCSLKPPFMLQDANFPKFVGFKTDDLLEFKLFLTYWSSFYDFASFRSLYEIKKL